MRTVAYTYVDPLDAIWLSVARTLGFQVERSPEVYAATDGAGVITVGTPETLDSDDCLAQMILHELCHALVQGPQHETAPDWGLDNQSDRDVEREHACLRLQAHLTMAYGLRELLAPTTEFRTFYDELAEDPLMGEGSGVELAKQGVERAASQPWATALERGLRLTAKVATAVHEAGEVDAASLWSRFSPPLAKG